LVIFKRRQEVMLEKDRERERERHRERERNFVNLKIFSVLKIRNDPVFRALYQWDW